MQLGRKPSNSLVPKDFMRISQLPHHYWHAKEVIIIYYLQDVRGCSPESLNAAF